MRTLLAANTVAIAKQNTLQIGAYFFIVMLTLAPPLIQCYATKTMSEHFNSASGDKHDTTIERLYAQMLEPDFLQLKKLLEKYQASYEHPSDEYIDEGEAMAEQIGIVNALHNESRARFQYLEGAEVLLGGKLRPIGSDADSIDSLDSLVMDTEGERNEFAPKIEQDERGAYVAVSDEKTYTYQGIDTIETPEGESFCLIVTDETATGFALLPDEIYALRRYDEDEYELGKNIEVLYPEVFAQLEKLRDTKDEIDLVTVLAEMDLRLHNIERHDAPENVAILLGQYATKIAQLDTASHQIIYKGAYRIENNEGELLEALAREDRVQYGDLQSIEFDAYQNTDGSYIFDPEITAAVGLPGKGSAHALLHIPAKNIDGLNMLRANEGDLFEDDEPVTIERKTVQEKGGYDFVPPEFAQADEFDAAETTGEYEHEMETDVERNFETYRQSLEETQAAMDNIYRVIKAADNKLYDSQDEYLAVLRECEFEKIIESNAQKQPWRYVGNGVRDPASVARGNPNATFGAMYGFYESAQHSLAEVVQDEYGAEEKMRLHMLMVFSHPTEESAPEELVSGEIGPMVEFAYELRQINTLRNTVLELAEMDEAPQLVDLYDIDRRKKVVKKAQELFADDELAQTVVAQFATGLNERLVADDQTFNVLPIDELRAVLESSPDRAYKLGELLAECLPSHGTQHFQVWSDGVVNAHTKLPHEPHLDQVYLQVAGIETAQIEGVESDGMPLLVGVSHGERVLVPLHKIEHLAAMEYTR